MAEEIIFTVNDTQEEVSLFLGSPSGGGSGTVTSVGLSSPDSALDIANSPITTTGTITATVNAANMRTAINVADGATANSTDAFLLARGNHTGTQLASTISDFDTEVENNAVVLQRTTRVGFAAKKSNTTILVAPAQNVVTFDIEIEDTNTAWDGTTFTVPVGEGGMYEILGHACLTSVTATNYFYVGILLNGSLDGGGLIGRQYSGGTGLNSCGGGMRFNLSAGDTIQMVVYCENVTTLFYSSPPHTGYNSFSAYKMIG